MHPGYQPDTIKVIVGFGAQLKYGIGCCKYRFKQDPYRDPGRIVEGLCNSPRIGSYLKQRIRSVQMLTACDKPDLFIIKVIHDILLFEHFSVPVYQK